MVGYTGRYSPLCIIVLSISQEKAFSSRKAGGTLWEGDELVLRFLVEDGKVNLCLRLVRDYLSFLDELESTGRELTAEESAVSARFERAAGVLLGNAWEHPEALQTSDLPLLVETTTSMARHSDPSVALEESLGGGALRFAHALGKNCEEVIGERLFEELLRRRTFDAIVRVAGDAASHDDASPDSKHILLCGLEGLAQLVDSEEFQTRKVRP